MEGRFGRAGGVWWMVNRFEQHGAERMGVRVHWHGRTAIFCLVQWTAWSETGDMPPHRGITTASVRRRRDGTVALGAAPCVFPLQCEKIAAPVKRRLPLRVTVT